MKKSFQAFTDGHISNDLFKDVSKDYQTQIDSIEYQLQHLNDSIKDRIDIARQAIELSYHIEDLYLRSDSKYKRKLLKMVLSNCTLEDTTLCPTYEKAFSLLMEALKTKNVLPET